jgi:hypothetical protein
MRSRLVSFQGASAGSILLGAGLTNKGLRLRILEDQKRGMEGPIMGRFIILDPGENARSDSLRALVNRATDAQEVLHALREDHPACVNVVNAHALTPESICWKKT